MLTSYLRMQNHCISQEILYGKADLEIIPTDSSLYLSPTKRMIVAENAKKWKIFFRLAVTYLAEMAGQDAIGDLSAEKVPKMTAPPVDSAEI